MRETLTNDFWGLHKNMNRTFSLNGKITYCLITNMCHLFFETE